MNKKIKIAVILLLSLSLLIPSSTSQAKGPPLLVRVNVPGRTGFIESREPAVLNSLAMASFENFFEEVESPVLSSAPVIITRYYDVQNYVPWDQVLYYPDPAGGRGYVYYVMIYNGWGPYDGRWYRATAAGEAALNTLLESKGIVLEVDSAGQAAFPTLPAIALLVGLLGTGGLVFKKRGEHLL